MMISQIWEKTESKLFDDAAGTSVGQEDIKGVCTIMDSALTRIGTFAGTVRSAEDLRALDKPWDEFHKSYMIFLATITSIGSVSRGKILKEDLVNISTQMTKAYIDFENNLPSIKDLSKKEELAKSCGKCLELVKRFEKIPLTDLQTIRRRLVIALSQIRDVKRELENECSIKNQWEDFDEDEDEKDDDVDDDEEDASSRLALASVLGDVDTILYSVIRYCGDTTTEITFLEQIVRVCKDICTRVDAACVAIDFGENMLDVAKLCAHLRLLEKSIKELNLELPAAWEEHVRLVEAI